MGNKLIKKKKATSSNADYEWDDKTIRKRNVFCHKSAYSGQSHISKLNPQ